MVFYLSLAQYVSIPTALNSAHILAAPCITSEKTCVGVTFFVPYKMKHFHFYPCSNSKCWKCFFSIDWKNFEKILGRMTASW